MAADDPEPTSNEPSSKTTDPFTPATLRALKIAVAVMGLILVFGFVGLVIAIAYKSSQLGKAVAVAAGTEFQAVSRVALPAGAHLEGSDLDGSRLALRYRSAAGEGVVVIDLSSGRVLTTIEVGPKP